MRILCIGRAGTLLRSSPAAAAGCRARRSSTATRSPGLRLCRPLCRRFLMRTPPRRRRPGRHRGVLVPRGPRRRWWTLGSTDTRRQSTCQGAEIYNLIHRRFIVLLKLSYVILFFRFLDARKCQHTQEKIYKYMVLVLPPVELLAAMANLQKRQQLVQEQHAFPLAQESNIFHPLLCV